MKKFKKIFLAAMPLAALSVTIPVVTTSCSSSESNTLGVVKFDAKETRPNSKNRAFGDNLPNTMEVVDPNLNKDAMQKAKDTFKKRLDVPTLQKDFDNVLSKFFKVVEYDTDKVESELRSVKVVNVNHDTMVADLEVTYEVETEVENDGDKKELKVIDKKMTLEPKFATVGEIDKLTRQLTNDSQTSGSIEFDVEDLKELYVGDPDDNEKSIFEQVSIITSESTAGGLLGYNLDLGALAYTENKPTSKVVDLIKTKVFAPSFEIREFYQPNMVETILPNGLDLTLNYDAIKNKTKANILSEINGTDETSAKTSVENFKKLLRNTTQDITSIVNATATDDPTNKHIQILLQINGTDGMPTLVAVGISYEWLSDNGTTEPSTGGNGNSGSSSNNGSSTGNVVA